MFSWCRIESPPFPTSQASARFTMATVQRAKSCISVVIAEANRLNCQLIESAFHRRRMGVAIVASAIESHRALLLLKEHTPDVAVISSQLGDGPLEGFRLLRELRSLQS